MQGAGPSQLWFHNCHPLLRKAHLVPLFRTLRRQAEMEIDRQACRPLPRISAPPPALLLSLSGLLVCVGLLGVVCLMVGSVRFYTVVNVMIPVDCLW